MILADAATRPLSARGEKEVMSEDDEHGRDVELAKEKSDDEEPEETDEAEEEAEEAAREQQERREEEEAEEASEMHEEEVREQENIDNHRDEEPFQS